MEHRTRHAAHRPTCTGERDCGSLAPRPEEGYSRTHVRVEHFRSNGGRRDGAAAGRRSCSGRAERRRPPRNGPGGGPGSHRDRPGRTGGPRGGSGPRRRGLRPPRTGTTRLSPGRQHCPPPLHAAHHGRPRDRARHARADLPPRPPDHGERPRRDPVPGQRPADHLRPGPGRPARALSRTGRRQRGASRRPGPAARLRGRALWPTGGRPETSSPG